MARTQADMNPRGMSLTHGANGDWEGRFNLQSIEVPPGTLYMPLQNFPQHIRLAILQPGLPHEDIKCILAYVSISGFLNPDLVYQGSLPYYEALSYVWGDPDVTEPITVDGMTFQVTTNLTAALQRLRWVTRSRVLWIDSICINQKDPVEKGVQVALMFEIFQNASQVIVWLGEDSADSGKAMFLLEELSEMSVGQQCPWLVPGRNSVAFTLQSSLLALLQRPWWNRAWILQEVTMAKNALVYCGGRSLWWRQVKKAMLWLDDHYGGGFEGPTDSIPHDTWRHIISMCSLRWVMINGLQSCGKGFLEVLSINRTRGATNPSDKVYAFTRMAYDTPQTLLTPNYMESTSELYSRTARALIEEQQNLDVLFHAGMDEYDDKDPSWVPRWNRISTAPPLAPRMANDKLYKASANRKAKLQSCSNLQTIALQGLCLDTITIVGETMSSNQSLINHHDALSQIRQWQALVGVTQNPFERYYNNDAYVKAFCHTILSGISAFPAQVSRSGDATFEKPSIVDDVVFATWTGRAVPSNRLAQEVASQVKAHPDRYHDPFVQSVMVVSSGRRLVRTSKGYLALVPPLTQAGDLICVLFGGSAPFVLRAKGDAHFLIGEAYVHGFMDGEAVGMLKRDELKSHVFTIR